LAMVFLFRSTQLRLEENTSFSSREFNRHADATAPCEFGPTRTARDFLAVPTFRKQSSCSSALNGRPLITFMPRPSNARSAQSVRQGRLAVISSVRSWTGSGRSVPVGAPAGRTRTSGPSAVSRNSGLSGGPIRTWNGASIGIPRDPHRRLRAIAITRRFKPTLWRRFVQRCDRTRVSLQYYLRRRDSAGRR